MQNKQRMDESCLSILVKLGDFGEDDDLDLGRAHGPKGYFEGISKGFPGSDFAISIFGRRRKRILRHAGQKSRVEKAASSTVTRRKQRGSKHRRSPCSSASEFPSQSSSRRQYQASISMQHAARSTQLHRHPIDGHPGRCENLSDTARALGIAAMKRARNEIDSLIEANHVGEVTAGLPKISRKVHACTECQARKIKCDVGPGKAICTRWKSTIEGDSKCLQRAVSKILDVLDLPSLESFHRPTQLVQVVSPDPVIEQLQESRTTRTAVMAMTREHSLDPESKMNDALVSAPMGSVYEVANSGT
ncbi:fungal specific transcription factor [Drepanopeziza brunnea f. sp. 'multigermtubi' MB_m1]|uniref:Fungal specific transcription factor n=1 Tax=Marssonina brunnea f. sp. multigermtubi (strain MB_m1) TaxID=1072389 RepID=K1X750_MARBU|nr:fungal specific transcription factor [Drepanopeziza brunnea f. sp. 'multigermtubi' MB_m1]EKD20921.1 fungal specific transcription factor [Drepanopeziza brunnea f. sp. 'multigermtubi' MB_m1]